eukprot:CAMPEP_0178412976 /NCGR_PEP_ID=MMETSP0689_2-20121128/22292_1 /TAXON_ID=160604 /ORGANISM="Amphidinium massartii, Strain CS-259" /LENGTH=574 /DNA_ID=CAMNT_0020034239 /DNA_START=36 /DNA_END=1757 /DNA_ORIENTATION=-
MAAISYFPLQLLALIHAILHVPSVLAVRPVMDEDLEDVVKDHSTPTQQASSESAAPPSSPGVLAQLHANESQNLDVRSFGGKILFLTTAPHENMDSNSDGVLTKEGDKLATDRVALLAGEANELMVHVQEVWVAPTVAAIETAISALTQSWISKVDSGMRFPKLRMLPVLQPFGDFQKYDNPEGVMETLHAHALETAKRMLGEDNMHTFTGDAQGIGTEYLNWREPGLWDFLYPQPSSAIRAHDHFHELKSIIAKRRVERLIIVADRTFITWFLMAGFPSSGSESPRENLLSLCRQDIQALKMAGAATAEWKVVPTEGDFKDRYRLVESSDEEGMTVPFLTSIKVDSMEFGHPMFPNLDNKVHMNIPFDEMGFAGYELLALGKRLVPPKSHWSSFSMRQLKDVGGALFEWTQWKDRILSIILEFDAGEKGTEKLAYLLWASPFFEGLGNARNIHSFSAEMVYEGEFAGSVRLTDKDERSTSWILKRPQGIDDELYLQHFVLDIQAAQRWADPLEEDEFFDAPATFEPPAASASAPEETLQDEQESRKRSGHSGRQDAEELDEDSNSDGEPSPKR